MKSIRIVFVASALVVMALLGITLPALAKPTPERLIYFGVPSGAGGTYSCGSGPPFISELGSGQDNCALYQRGAPADMSCDAPTPVTFEPARPDVRGLTQLQADGFLCH